MIIFQNIFFDILFLTLFFDYIMISLWTSRLSATSRMMSRSLDGVRRSKLSRLATMPMPPISTVAGENNIRSGSGAKKHCGRDSLRKNTIVLNFGDEAIRLLGDEAGSYHVTIFRRGSYSSAWEAPAVREPVWLAFSGIMPEERTFLTAVKWFCRSVSCTKIALA